MMRQLRDKKTMQVILWLVVVFFVGTIFLAWGMKFKGPASRDPNLLAKVGEENISYAQFNKVYQPALDRLYGSRNETPSEEETKTLKGEVLDRLVEDAILRLEAQ